MRPSGRYSLGKVGLIAGVGVLPLEFMRAAHVLGHEVVVIGVVSDIDPAQRLRLMLILVLLN